MEAVKEQMWSELCFDLVYWELFPGWRDWEIHWHTPLTCTYWPFSDSCLPREQRPPPETSVCDLTRSSEPAMDSSWMEELQKKNSLGCHKSFQWFVGNTELSESKKSVPWSGAWEHCISKGPSLSIKRLKDF